MRRSSNCELGLRGENVGSHMTRHCVYNEAKWNIDTLCPSTSVVLFIIYTPSTVVGCMINNTPWAVWVGHDIYYFSPQTWTWHLFYHRMNKE